MGYLVGRVGAAARKNSACRCQAAVRAMKSGFHSVELNKTVWEVPERYVNLTAIGSGAYGQVCSAEDTSLRSADGKFIKVAIKKIARPFQSAVHAKRTYRELRMLKHMVHENIIGLLDCFTPQSTLFCLYCLKLS